MPSRIANLSETEQRRLLDGLNYLNLAELRTVCARFAIPFAIYVENADGERRRSRDVDRKSVVLDRVRTFLKSGTVPPPTCFRACVVRDDDPPAELRPDDRLYYGWYDKKNPAILDVLARVTGGKYRNGAVARILMREFWTAGTAPTFAEFGDAWLRADAKGLGIADGDHPEAAWLTDRARGEGGSDWKAKRRAIATEVLRSIEAISD